MDIIGLLYSPYPQIRATRATVGSTCVVLNVPSTKLNVIVTSVPTLSYLLRLEFHERDAFGMGRLPWRQVGC